MPDVVVDTPASASIEPRAGRRDIEAAANESLSALASAATRIADLAITATELDERAAALADAESEADRMRHELADAAARNAAVAAELAQREVTLAAELSKLRVRSEYLDRREELVEQAHRELVEQARELEERAARFHWRWLLRAWCWRPRLPGRAARTCELFFVPSPEGYKLLENEGVALTPRARLSGLLDERRTFVVTKIAPWPLDDRWCAYLQQD